MNENTLLFETLSNLGVSRSQAKLYLAFLREGASSVSQMAKLLNTSRQAIYLLLSELQNRGLVKEIPHGKRSLYQALPPTQLFSLVEELRTNLEAIVPSLTNLQTLPSDIPLVTIYDTPLAMREWYRYFLETAEAGDAFYLYSSGSLENWYKLDPVFYQNYMEQQVKRGIQLKCLASSGSSIDAHKNSVGWSVSEYRVTSTQLSPNVEQWIWRDQICYQTIQGNSTNLIVIKSQPLADFAMHQFMEVWQRGV